MQILRAEKLSHLTIYLSTMSTLLPTGFDRLSASAADNDGNQDPTSLEVGKEVTHFVNQIFRFKLKEVLCAVSPRMEKSTN